MDQPPAAGISDFDGHPFASSPNALLLIDEGRRYVDANQPALRLLGFSREQLLGMRTADLILGMEPGELASIEGRFRRAGEDAGVFRVRAAAGSVTVLVHSKANVAPGLHLAEMRLQDDPLAD